MSEKDKLGREAKYYPVPVVMVDDFPGSAEVECPECGAEPGQQCCIVDTESATWVHAARAAK
jgi:hypothetical protein